MVTAWPGVYGPKVVMLLPSAKSSRSRLKKSDAALRATV